MSTIDLIILGFLVDSDANAYDIAAVIAGNPLYQLLKISTPAVYKRCKGLADEGLIDGAVVRTKGKPNKTVYAINRQGKARFQKLMSHFAGHVSPFFLEFNAFVSNLEKVDRKQGRQLLENLRAELGRWQLWLEAHERELPADLPFSNRAIVRQYRMTVSTLVTWSEETLADYERLPPR